MYPLPEHFISERKSDSMTIDLTALTALIISLTALVATSAQLLQQYFAIADGYGKCLPEVMGDDWGSKTRKRMRWRELCYETLYYGPGIFPGETGSTRLSVSKAFKISPSLK
jgi:hypothetical protein